MPDPTQLARDHRRGGIVARVTLVTTAVALLAVVITGVVAMSLIRGAAEDQARVTLGRQADLMAVALDRDAGTPGQRPVKLAQVLRAQEIGVFFLRAKGQPPELVTDADLALLAGGQPVSDIRDINGARWLFEARPTDGPADVVLAQPAAFVGSTAAEARRRLLLPLVLGLAGSVVAGWLLARWLARPMQRAAEAAHRLATGARDVRLPLEGPAEVADLSEALNLLSDALATSEGRERAFLLSISHELRTPLTAVRGYAEALADGVVPTEDVSRTGATVLAESERLDRLVSDLLDLARLGAQDFRVDTVLTDLRVLVIQAADVWSTRCLAAGVDFVLEVPPGPLEVWTDPGRVRQIIDGLAENALRVTPEGAPVVLAVRSAPGFLIIEVRDGGPGLTDDDLSVAFDRGVLYERYRGVRKVGTGLGLALVAGLAIRLGGEAVAGRAEEGGASFGVRLPNPSAAGGSASLEAS